MAGERLGKCVNIGNCGLADKRAPVPVPAGKDFVCPECGKGLIAATSGDAGSSRRSTLVVIGCAALVAVGAVLFALRGCAPPAAVDPASTRVTLPAPASETAPAPAAAPPSVVPAAASRTGDCSPAHERVGLCKPQ